jgi:hypothetical protein
VALFERAGDLIMVTVQAADADPDMRAAADAGSGATGELWRTLTQTLHDSGALRHALNNPPPSRRGSGRHAHHPPPPNLPAPTADGCGGEDRVVCRRGSVRECSAGRDDEDAGGGGGQQREDGTPA